MEKEKNKYLYETTVKKEVIEQVTEEREENGQKIKITRDSKQIKPVKIAILKPDRKKYKEADIFFAKTLSNYLKEGLLPYSLVSKRYMNDGGPMTDNEKRAINLMYNKYGELQEEYFKMNGTLTEEQTKRRSEIILEMTEINRSIQQIKDSYSEIFNNTAEAKTKNDAIEWWVLNLSLIDEDGKGYTLLYGDGPLESKNENLEKLESKEDLFTNEVIKKLSYFISFWYASGADITIEDFKSAEEHYTTNISDYMKDEEKKESPPVNNTENKVENPVIENPVVEKTPAETKEDQKS